MLEPDLWWLLPYGLLILAMLHAMMELTVSLLAERPPADRRPVSADELRRRLLAARDLAPSGRLAEGGDADLEIRWEVEDAGRRGRWAFARAGRPGSPEANRASPRIERRRRSGISCRLIPEFDAERWPS